MMSPAFRFLPLTVVCLGISFLSHQPADVFNTVKLPEGADKLVHLFMFLCVGSSAGWGFEGLARKSMSFGVLFAIFDEMHQSFIPGRSVEFLDLVFDVLGTLMGIFMIRVWLQKTKGAHDG